jgi:hypothetical protein
LTCGAIREIEILITDLNVEQPRRGKTDPRIDNLLKALQRNGRAPLQKGDRDPIDALIELLGHRRATALSAARAIVALGHYKHVDVIEKMIERNQGEASGAKDDHIFRFFPEALEFKRAGYDFRVHFVKEHDEFRDVLMEGLDGQMYTAYHETVRVREVLMILRGEPLPTNSRQEFSPAPFLQFSPAPLPTQQRCYVCRQNNTDCTGACHEE